MDVRSVLCSVLLLCAPVAVLAQSPAEEPVVLGVDASAAVAVVNVAADDGTVSGVLVNRLDRPVHDVQLLIRHMWIAKSERDPNANGPGRAVFYTLSDAIPPHGRVPFRYQGPPLRRADGSLRTSVEVVGFTAARGAPHVALVGH